MESPNAPRQRRMSRDDDEVFRLLNEAEQQLDRYLLVKMSRMFPPPTIERQTAPPSDRLPLSLTIWDDGPLNTNHVKLE